MRIILVRYVRIVLLNGVNDGDGDDKNNDDDGDGNDDDDDDDDDDGNDKNNDGNEYEIIEHSRFNPFTLIFITTSFSPTFSNTWTNTINSSVIPTSFNTFSRKSKEPKCTPIS